MTFKKKLPTLIITCTLSLFGFFLARYKLSNIELTEKKGIKLYWFIPDGLRADPKIFNIYQWANDGHLPNIKKMMNNGSYGYSIPVFPGHSATNFATLLTGTLPSEHQVVDGPMRLPGYPLQLITKQGFSSTAREVPAIWTRLEDAGLKTFLLSVPGSTPPEISRGVTVRGRWGGWGIDIPSIIFHTDSDEELKRNLGNAAHIFQYGPALTTFINHTKKIENWKIELPKSFSRPYEIHMNTYNMNIYGYVYDSIDDEKENYDSIILAKDKSHLIANLRENSWSPWIKSTVFWEEKNDYSLYNPKKSEFERSLSETKLNTDIKFKIVKLGKDGFFRIRVLFNNLNESLIDPSPYFEIIDQALGPMVDFVDNYPPQLVYFPEDRNTFLEEKDMSMDWHKKSVAFVNQTFKPNIIIHDVYNPNQMLTSRWWLSSMDPDAADFDLIDPKIKKERFQDVLKMYKQIDDIMGEAIKNSDENTYIVLSSDHGIVPLNTEVRLNNLFAQKKWLTFVYDEKLKIHRIDWKKTKVVYLNMDNIYINPNGLDGKYKRTNGEAYEKLRKEVIVLLESLQDTTGKSPLDKVVKWENLAELNIQSERTGDLVIANHNGFHWSEELSFDYKIFVKSFMSGYKQAIIPKDVNGMLTPFIIMGPGIKKNYSLTAPIDHIQQFPTILKLLKVEFPENLRKNILYEIFTTKTSEK